MRSKKYYNKRKQDIVQHYLIGGSIFKMAIKYKITDTRVCAIIKTELGEVRFKRAKEKRRLEAYNKRKEAMRIRYKTDPEFRKKCLTYANNYRNKKIYGDKTKID